MNVMDRDPRFPIDWRYGPFFVSWVDRGTMIDYTSVNMWIKYPDFLAVLHELTIDIAHTLPDLPIFIEMGEGLSLREGPWYYRIVHPAMFVPNQGWTDTGDAPIKGLWKKLHNIDSYQAMRGEFMETRVPAGSSLEIKHYLQKYRDTKHRRTQASFERPAPVIVNGTGPPEQTLFDQDFPFQPELQPFLPPATLQPNDPLAAQFNSNDLLSDLFGDLAGASTLTSMSQSTNTNDTTDNSLSDKSLLETTKLDSLSSLKDGNIPRRTMSLVKDANGHASVKIDYEYPTMRNLGVRNSSFVTNPYAGLSPPNSFESVFDGPGPAVSTSPSQFSSFSLGSPAVTQPRLATSTNMKPAEFSYNHESFRCDPRARKFPPLYWQRPEYIRKNMRTGSHIQTTNPGHLDPALDDNQTVNPVGTHRIGIFESSSRPVINQTRRSDIGTVQSNQDGGFGENVAAEGPSDIARTSRRNTISNIKRKVAQRATKTGPAQQEEVDKEREKVKEILDKQRDERVKRAAKRKSMN